MGTEARRILVLPWSSPPSAYQRLLRAALMHDRPCLVDTSVTIHFTHFAAPPDVVHVHWPEKAYTRASRGPISWLLSVAGALRLIVGLALIRARRALIVWTVHNRFPHESAHPRLDAAIQQAMFRVAHRVVVHSEYARREVINASAAAARKTIVIPHPNFCDVYPSSGRSRSQVRSALDLGETEFVCLAFGYVRRYKRLDRLIEALRSLPKLNCRLIIAGAGADTELLAELTRLARGDERVSLLLKHVPDDEVADLHAAADVAVLAYDDIFTSGALMLALSLGVPVLAPARGSAEELAAPPAVITWGREATLSEALADVVDAGMNTEARGAAVAAVEPLSWARAAHMHHDRAYLSETRSCWRPVGRPRS